LLPALDVAFFDAVEQPAEDERGRACIAPGAVSRFVLDTEEVLQRVERAVADLWHHPPGQPHGTEDAAAQRQAVSTLQLLAEEPPVERCVVRHEHRAGQEAAQRIGDLLEVRGRGNHFTGDPRERGDERRNRTPRIEECRVLGDV
jgi:hypothetical protein